MDGCAGSNEEADEAQPGAGEILPQDGAETCGGEPTHPLDICMVVPWDLEMEVLCSTYWRLHRDLELTHKCPLPTFNLSPQIPWYMRLYPSSPGM